MLLIFSKCLRASDHGDSQTKSCSCRCDVHFSDWETYPDITLFGGRTTHITLYRNLPHGDPGFLYHTIHFNALPAFLWGPVLLETKAEEGRSWRGKRVERVFKLVSPHVLGH